MPSLSCPPAVTPAHPAAASPVSFIGQFDVVVSLTSARSILGLTPRWCGRAEGWEPVEPWKPQQGTHLHVISLFPSSLLTATPLTTQCDSRIFMPLRKAFPNVIFRFLRLPVFNSDFGHGALG